MKKVLLLNGSPRKNWNTHILLQEAERGARDAGAETKLVHLYDLDFSDCRSCFECKLKDGHTNGICALRDGLRSVLEYAHDADAIIVGSPIYYSNLTAPVIAFKNRLLFPVMYYEKDPATGMTAKVPIEPKKCGLIVTANAPEQTFTDGYTAKFSQEAAQFGRILGSAEMIYACETYQFNDYGKYHAGMFDEKQRAERREKQFPVDKQNAYELGKRLAGE